jgi:Phage capsid family
MSDKQRPLYSLTRALQQTVEHGVPTSGYEREFHFETVRAIQSSPEMAGRTMPEGAYHSLYVPLSVVHRDLSVSGGPSTGAALVGLRTFGRSDLATWSAVINAGALLVTGLRENATFWQISTLPLPSWNTEFGMQAPTDPVFTGFSCTPKRLAAITLISRQLLIQSPDLDEMLRADFARQLGSLVDQVCLLGAGPAQNQPTGIAGTTGVNQIAGNAYADFVHAERLCGDANVSMDFYSVITNPAGKEILQNAQVLTGYPRFVWETLTNPKATAEVSDGRAYMGCWQMLTIAVWGALEIWVNPYVYAETSQLLLLGNLWVDVAVRLPAAFAYTTNPVS